MGIFDLIFGNGGKMNPQRIHGDWKAGWSLDLHTVSSTMNSDGSYDTKRTEIGEKLYRLKYCNEPNEAGPLAKIASDYIINNLLVYKYLSSIVPIPPSNLNRPYQPVFLLANEISKLTNITVATDYLSKRKETSELKEIDNIQIRQQELSNAFTVADNRFMGEYVLLFDDLYRSGATLNAATSVLMQEGQVSKVFVLTLTRTRVNT